MRLCQVRKERMKKEGKEEWREGRKEALRREGRRERGKKKGLSLASKWSSVKEVDCMVKAFRWQILLNTTSIPW